ncbi:monocarboxylate transporter 13-like [Anneissia japonica]|uniref:monocarboxylate transporter 13-like n=1 Tax=Anneissia japonica TaxID=1529436 RepID=UPI001425A7A4|nr:monocarboxylate transporter 13-like [Anneissia japonica]
MNGRAHPIQRSDIHLHIDVPVSDMGLENTPIVEPCHRITTMNRRYYRGWMVCLAGFILDVPFMGMVMSFGELLSPLLDTFGGGTALISWVGSIGFGMAYVANPISANLYHRFGCRRVSLCGVLLGAISLFLCSYVKSFGLMFLTYSLMFGFATNLTYNPPLILTGAWFQTHHHVLATCTLVAGIPFGSLVMNPVCEALLERVGLEKTFVCLSVVVLVIGIPCSLVFAQPPDDYDELDEKGENDIGVQTPKTQIPNSDSGSEWLKEMISKEREPYSICCVGCQPELWTDSIFLLYLLGQFVKGLGYVFPFIHLVTFMRSIGIPGKQGSIVMTIKGLSDMIGRLLAGILGESLPFQIIHMYVICTGIMAITTYLVTFAHNFTHMVFYAIFIGFFNGVFNSLLFPTTTQLFRKDLARQAWAFCQVPPGIAIIIGPGVAGFIYDATKNYTVDFYVNTGIFELAMLIFASIPAIRLGRWLWENKHQTEESKRRPTVIEMTRLFVKEYHGKRKHQQKGYSSFE